MRAFHRLAAGGGGVVLALSVAVSVWAVPARATGHLLRSQCTGPRPSIDATEVLRCLRRGQRVVLSGTRIHNPLALGDLGIVRAPFKCRGCRLDGLLASDVVFARTIDLSGSRILGRADLEGATFQGPALFGSTVRRSTSFAGGANFSLALFDDLASFEGAMFAAQSEFRFARFRSDASFSGASFPFAATFERVSFGAAADFRQADFQDRAIFTSATFLGRADFSQAKFRKRAVFMDAQFTGPASFLRTTFDGSTSDHPAAEFDDVGAATNLDFSFAAFNASQSTVVQPTAAFDPLPRRPEPLHVRLKVASFFGLVSAGTVSFRAPSIEPGNAVRMNEIAAKDLLMDVTAAAFVDDGPDDPARPNQRHVLELIAASAKARGDLGRANDALYRLHLLSGERYGGFRRVVDLAYRYVLGYLLRPLDPLLSLLVLAAGLSFVRLLGRRLPRLILRRWFHKPLEPFRCLLGRLAWAIRHPLRRLAALLWALLCELWALFNTLLDTLILIGPRRWDPGGGGRTGWRRLEAILYRALLVCALIGLAKSNPTLREVIDALV